MHIPVPECPRCGCAGFDLADYDSMIVITADFALFTLTCPSCGARVSAMRPIPDALRDEVRYAAIEVGAGMGQIG